MGVESLGDVEVRMVADEHTNEVFGVSMVGKSAVEVIFTNRG